LLIGSVDGEEFRNPATTRLWMTIDVRQGVRMLGYPTDCNDTSGPIDVHGGWFGAGDRASTMVGCDTSRQVMLFETAFARADQIRLEGGELVLAGPDVELRFGPPPSAEFLGELPLTAAGETLTFEVPGGRERSGTYLLGGHLDDPFGWVYFQLTAAVAGEGEPTWGEYRGQPDSPGVMVSGPGPDTILVPDVGEGDFALCSPYWEPDPFCFTLRVRPPSQPWIVTAGSAGVVLLDADGTSRRLWDGPAAVAYHLDGRVLIEPVGGEAKMILLESDGSEMEIQIETGERLLEAALVGGQPLAVLAGSAGTVVLDVDTGERNQVGPQATAATMAGGFLALRLTPEIVIGVTLDGQVMWEREVDARTMVLGPGDVFRFDILDTLQPDAGPESYFQYVVTEFVELTTGETFEAYDREVAIPDVGDNIAEPCIRPDLSEVGVLVCTQPDGRVVTLEVDGGDSRTVATGVAAATFARPLR
jgi:heat shock protein HslJ